MTSEKSTDTTEQIGRMDEIFADEEVGDIRRYWFVGGMAAGIMGVGTVYHWNIDAPPLGLIIIGLGIAVVLKIAKRRGEWDV